MVNRNIILALAAVSLSAGASPRSVVSPLTTGILERATVMSARTNAAGALDLTDRILRSTLLTPSERDDTEYINALSLLQTGDTAEGYAALERFVANHAASPLRWKATLALAAADIAEGSYAMALRRYDTIPDNAFAGDAARELTLNRAYCRLLQGDADAALPLFEAVGNDGLLGEDARFYRGYIAYIKGDNAKARRLFEGLSTTRAPERYAGFYLMEMDFADRRFDRALSEAQRMLADTSTPTEFTAECNRVAGESLYNLNQEKKGLPYLWKYAAAVSNPAPSAFYILGVNELADGDSDAAIKLLQRAVAADNAMAQSAYLLLGQAYLKRGDKDSALMAFEKAYRMNYDRQVQETAFYNYAVARLDGGRVPFGSSVDLLDDFLREFPDSRYAPRVQQYMVEGYMSQNDYEAALRALDGVRNPSAELRQARQQVLFVLGSREYTSGRFEAARTHLKEVTDMNQEGLNPSVTAQARLWLGDCLYHIGDYPGAAQQFQLFMKSESAESDPYNRALARYGLGYARFASGNYAEALNAFEKAITTGKAGVLDQRALADANNRAGDCLYYLGRLDDASRRYAAAYDLHPGSGDYAIYQLAVVEGMRGNHADKIDRLNRLMTDFPTTGLVPSALLEKAESQLAMGRRDAAIATYRALVADHAATVPGRKGYLQLALTYLNGSDRQAAIDTYKEVITRYPSSDEARLAADDLKRLYAADNRLEEYASFINAIPEAPRIDRSEMEHLSFEAAENAYAADGSTGRLEEYIASHPAGADAPKALYYMAESAWNKGNSVKTEKIADELLENFPHSECAEDAMLLKAQAQMAQNKYEPALRTLRELESRASDAAMVSEARKAIMRAADALGRWSESLEEADALMSSTAANSGDTPGEITYYRARALNGLGRVKEARNVWRQLAAYPDNIYGSMSAVALGQSLYDAGELKAARETIDALIDANPPHSYWLARGFILYSDILRRQGKEFEAREYLKSLQSNYPGKEADIQNMINQRLNK